MKIKTWGKLLVIKKNMEKILPSMQPIYNKTPSTEILPGVPERGDGWQRACSRLPSWTSIETREGPSSFQGGKSAFPSLITFSSSIYVVKIYDAEEGRGNSKSLAGTEEQRANQPPLPVGYPRPLPGPWIQGSSLATA